MKKHSVLMKYHGGKSRLADWIISFMPPHRCYVEPFGGGGSVLLRKQPVPTEVYNDLNGEIFNLFRMIRERSAELAALIYLTPYSRAEMDLAYEPCDDPLESARRLFVRAHMSISTTSINSKSGFRAAINSKDYCSQFFTWYKTPETIMQVRDRLARVAIENVHALALLDRYDLPKTLWYLDPPYMNGTRSKKSQRHGYNCNMTDAEHIELLRRAKELRGMVMISGYKSELYLSELADWRLEKKGTYDDNMNKKEEYLWMNFEEGQQKLFV
jgi:DNA adenine methylase